MSQVVINTDGAARGNPGPAAIAYVIQLPGETLEHAETIGITTNNQAEYRALNAALRRLGAVEIEGCEVVVNSDSELMIKQLRGEYRVKDQNLRPIFDEIMGCLTKLKASGNTVTLNAVRREFNKRADELGNLALDGKL